MSIDNQLQEDIESKTVNFIDDANKVRYLNVVLNDQVYEGSFKNLIEGFDELKAVTFVSSPKAFFDFTKGFKKIVLVLGIEDNDAVKSFDVLNPEVVTSFLKDLDQKTIESIVNQEIEVRYVKIGNTIHSKIFLLESEKRKRLIIGSANLTMNALSDKFQFEELVVYDDEYNSKIVSIYEQRFDYIYNHTVDYIPDKVRKSKDYTINIMSSEDAVNLFKDILTKNVDTKISSDVYKDIIIPNYDAALNLDIEHRTSKESKQLFDKVTKETKNGISFISPKEVEKKIPSISKLIKQNMKTRVIKDERIGVVYNFDKGFLYRTDGSIYSKEIENSKIIDALDKIEGFIEAYELFTIGTDSEKLIMQKRVFEAILYTLVSPFIWKLRELYVRGKQSEVLRGDIPVFLLVTGKSQTGKTHLLEFLKVITGSEFYTYDQEAKSKYIKAYLECGEVFPLLVDEIDKQYFTSTTHYKNKGEDYIKTISNVLKDTHPCVIATSNNKFGIAPQVDRRIYYLEMKTSFDLKQKRVMDDYYAKTTEDLTDEFMKDFTYRMTIKLGAFNEIEDDYLKLGREILKDYYKEAGKKLPKWFNETLLDDYDEKSRNIWKWLFTSRREGFIIRGNVIIVDTLKVFGDQHWLKEEAKRFLDPAIVKEDSVILELDKARFFQFIGYQEGWFSRFRRVIRK